MNQSASLAYSASLPGKRMASGCLFLNQAGELLIVKPIYRDDWLLPGGSLEKDESPAQGCVREVLEELGLKKPVLRLLCLEYQSAHNAGTESLQFIFYGGVLNDPEIAAIQLQREELAEFRFCTRETALSLLAGKLAERMKFGFRALDENQVIYLEDKSETLWRSQ
jgi:8-oxo-dGTP pyrophosphatase MutT (NUDIX family)